MTAAHDENKIDDRLVTRSNNSSPSPKFFIDIVRCCRCQRSLGIDPTSSYNHGVVRFGINSYYCKRCAKVVGYIIDDYRVALVERRACLLPKEKLG